MKLTVGNLRQVIKETAKKRKLDESAMGDLYQLAQDIVTVVNELASDEFNRMVDEPLNAENNWESSAELEEGSPTYEKQVDAVVKLINDHFTSRA